MMISSLSDNSESRRFPSHGIEVFNTGIENSETVLTSNELQRLFAGSTAYPGDLSDATMTDKVCIFLPEMSKPLLSDCSETTFHHVMRMVKSAVGIIWVTRGGTMDCEIPEASIITGLARSARSENRRQRFITLDLDPISRLQPAAVAHIIRKIYQTAFVEENAQYEAEYSERGGQLFIPRLVDHCPASHSIRSTTQTKKLEVLPFFDTIRPLRLEAGTPGLLETLRWTDQLQEQFPLSLGPEDIEVEVRAVGVNFRDVMISLGRLPGLALDCGEYSGVVTAVGTAMAERYKRGDRVCVFGRVVCANKLRIPGLMAHGIPDGMAFETAASIPFAYTTAYRALVDVARLQNSESILVHSAAGGVGQASIMLAQHLGAAKIFVTVGNEKKKKFLMEKFGIPEDRIFSSRSNSFVAGIKRLTAGIGVDVILNSLSGELLRETFNCIAQFGRFVEIGKRDIMINGRMEMRMFDNNVTFTAIDLRPFWHKPEELQRLVKESFTLLNTGSVLPVTPLSVFPIWDVESAYRQIQAGKHVGKIVLKADAECKVKVRNCISTAPA
jgi:NADPH:quinone reductase-like Zn-dependent oxidoreductase